MHQFWVTRSGDAPAFLLNFFCFVFLTAYKVLHCIVLHCIVLYCFAPLVKKIQMGRIPFFICFPSNLP